MRWLFTAAIFLAATLLFMVQPLAGKMLLPVVGGSPAVWTTCMLFFQAALLAGYLYSHLVTTRLPVKAQVGLHAGLILLAIAWLPFAPPAAEPPATGAGALLGWLLLTLTSSVGVPFLLVSTSGPLLQRWFSNTDDPSAKDPYFLYAASNLGSAVGLLGYPFLLERQFNISGQSFVWFAMYILLSVLLISCGVTAAKSAKIAPGSRSARAEATAEAITWSRRMSWIALAAVPSSLMIGVTQHLSTDLAAVPLLWVVPLFLYLLTFSVAFSPRVPLSASWLWWAFAVLALVDGFFFMTLRNSPFLLVGSVHVLGFTLASLMCHRRLADDRPSPSRLTEFFFWIALGGVVGGLFNAVVAPTLFTLVFEYPLALAACLWLRPAPLSIALRLPRWVAPVGLPLAFAAGIALVMLSEPLIRQGGSSATKIEIARAVTAMVLVMGLALFTPITFAVGLFVAAVCFGHWNGKLAFGDKTLLLERSFFGVHHAYSKALLNPDATALDGGGVVEVHRLSHGTTLHGAQLLGTMQRQLADGSKTLMSPATIATTYYHAAGPAGDLMRSLSNSPAVYAKASDGLLAANELARAGSLASLTSVGVPQLSAWAAEAVARGATERARSVAPSTRVAVIGLGSGTMASYARKGDEYTFFEIDPVVARFASEPTVFRYLSDAQARGAGIRIVLGDGRLNIVKEPDGAFGLIVLDAFSSDSIPVHLLTREALEMYLTKLRPDGVVAFHVSNRYFDLRPIFANLAADLKVAGYLGETHRDFPVTAIRGINEERKHYELMTDSSWVVIGKTREAVAGFRGQTPYWVPLTPRPGDNTSLWTDDFSDVLSAFIGWKN